MKKGYKSPNTATVKLNLNGSVLGNTVNVENGSPHGRWEDAAAKRIFITTNQRTRHITSPIGTSDVNT